MQSNEPDFSLTQSDHAYFDLVIFIHISFTYLWQIFVLIKSVSSLIASQMYPTSLHFRLKSETRKCDVKEETRTAEFSDFIAQNCYGTEILYIYICM